MNSDRSDAASQIMILYYVLSHLRSSEGGGSKPRKPFKRKLNLNKGGYGANL